MPGGEGVGGEPLVDHADGAHEIGVIEFAVELGDLGCEEEPLVDDGFRRHGGDVEKVMFPDVLEGGDLGLGAFADDVEFALEFVRGHAGGGGDEDLFDVGLGGTREASDGVGVDGGIAPAEDLEVFLAGDAFEDTFAAQTGVGLDGEEDHSDAVFARSGEGEAEAGALLEEELVGDLDGDAGSVARARIAAAGSAVGEVDEDLNTLLDDVVGRDALEIGDKAHATGIFFMSGVIQALLLG